MSEQKEILKPTIEKPIVVQPLKPEIPASPEKSTTGVSKESTEQVGDFLATQANGAGSSAAAISPELERQVEIERILEDDLSNVYFNLPEDKKETFRVQGEETAKEINDLLSVTKIRIQKIINLIRKWLLIIPGVNRFFLEQEAKLKADEIIKIKDKF